jgi:hypothetical protein
MAWHDQSVSWHSSTSWGRGLLLLHSASEWRRLHHILQALDESDNHDIPSNM